MTIFLKGVINMKPIDAAWILLKQQGRVMPIDHDASPFPKGLTPMQEKESDFDLQEALDANMDPNNPMKRMLEQARRKKNLPLQLTRPQ